MTTVEAIAYQSLVDANKAPYQQISNLVLGGFVTINAKQNTDRGRLYGSFTHSSGNYVLRLYRDSARSLLVASATSPTLPATVPVTASNGSGISGSVCFQRYQADDTNINVVCFLTTDDDLRFANLSALGSYDPLVGFAEFHLQGFDEARRQVISRQKANVWNPDYLDSRNLHGVTGGYDLSRCLNFYDALREAIGYYVLSLICQGQYVQPDSIFDVRGKEAWKQAKASFDSADLTWSFSQSRVEERERTNRTRKLERA